MVGSADCLGVCLFGGPSFWGDDEGASDETAAALLPQAVALGAPGTLVGGGQATSLETPGTSGTAVG